MGPNVKKCASLAILFIFEGGPWGPLCRTQSYQIFRAVRPHHRADKGKQAPVGTGMSRSLNSRWGMLLHVNEAGIYGGQNKIGVHVYHVGIAIYT